MAKHLFLAWPHYRTQFPKKKLIAKHILDVFACVLITGIV